MMNRKIVISAFTIFAVAAVVVGATTAFFSDTETSTGNTFTAGAIDLKIDNESYAIDYTIPGYTGTPIGAIVKSNATSWTLNDLTGQVFFNFVDLKPGDIGEDTISIHVDNNDAWACIAIQMTENSDNTCTEPEEKVDTSCLAYNSGDSNTHFNGELADKLKFAVWADDGDNVYENHEQLLQLGGPGVPIVTLQELAILSEIEGPAGVLTLADSKYNVFTGNWNPGEPLVGDDDYHLAKAWCFGDLQMTALNQDATGPLDRPSFATCNGVNVDNASQTDRVVGNIEFYAVQSRNNPGFTCAGDYIPSWGS